MTADSEDEGTTFIQNVKYYLFIDIVLYPKRLESSATTTVRTNLDLEDRHWEL